VNTLEGQKWHGSHQEDYFSNAESTKFGGPSFSLCHSRIDLSLYFKPSHVKMENRTRTQGLQASLLPHGRKAFPSTAGDEFPNGGKLFDVQVQSHKRAGAQMERESQGPLTRDGSGILAYPNLESKLPCLELW
jgi:hypothetical protein